MRSKKQPWPIKKDTQQQKEKNAMILASGRRCTGASLLANKKKLQGRKLDRAFPEEQSIHQTNTENKESLATDNHTQQKGLAAKSAQSGLKLNEQPTKRHAHSCADLLGPRTLMTDRADLERGKCTTRDCTR